MVRREYAQSDDMKVAVLIPPTEFRDETVADAVTMLKKWDVEPVITSWTRKDCTGSHGAVYRPKAIPSEVTTDSFDGIFISDGIGVDGYKLYDQRQLLDTIRHFVEKGKPVACVDNAVKILARANVITNKKIASMKDTETARLVQLFHGKITSAGIETDGNILTAGGAENAMSLVTALLDQLGVR